ncbi:MAG: S8 family serine peptidase, partial [Prevotella sp.]|nr:S8 family serine peptidase [Prevotella sp.]
MNKSNLKIKTVLAIVGGLFIGMGQMHADATHGHSSNNDHGVYTVDKRATSRRFVSGEVLVKFKNSSPVTVQRVKGRYKAASLQGVNSVLAAFGTEDMEQLMPNEVPNRSLRKVRSLNGGVIEEKDLSQLFLVKAKALTPDSTLMLVDRLKALGEVEYAEPNYKVYSLATDGETGTTDCDHYKKEPIYGQQWGHDRLKLPFLWQQKKLSDKRPVIAILDTGVDITHPDLAGNIWTNSAEQEGIEEADDDNNGLADDLHGWDFVNQTGRIGDWNGHGTHCAGIAAAVGNNGVGIAGANPDALLLPITVMQSDGTGDVATIIKGIDYAIACGADVLSMSFGGYSYSIAEEQALANAYTNAVLVAAAGNDCRPINPDEKCGVCMKWGAPMFPAAFTFVLGVEASAEGGGR